MDRNRMKRVKALEKELLAIEKQEKKMEQAALKARPAAWKVQLESKIPDKVYDSLETAFCRGFFVVFNQGCRIIEKSYRKEEIQADYSIRDYAVQVKGGRRELKQMKKSAKQSDTLNLAAATAEGVGLGALGIGMPDIVLFLGMLLRGIYETALNYGYEYESRKEKYLILKMMAASLSSGEDWRLLNGETEALLAENAPDITEEEFEEQMKAAAAAFAVDMLLLKFIQGIPIVGIIGGISNPVYYHRIMKYVQLKYRKRYLLGAKRRLEERLKDGNNR